MPAVILRRTGVAWSSTQGRIRPEREREEHACRWRQLPGSEAWVGEERIEHARPVAPAVALPELVHDLRHQLTHVELELEAGEPARARAALSKARAACEEALGQRPPRAVDLVGLCSEEARSAARAAQGRELQSSLPRECSLPCNEAALRRLLANLLGNALRANAEGEAVELFLARESDGGARILIRDRAGGFEREAIDRLLGSRASGSGSTGIGSLSVLECARRLCATICVHSEPGAGSEFEISLPG